MESPNIPEALRLGKHFGLDVNPDTVTFYVGRQTFIPTDELPDMVLGRQKLFALLSRNATPQTAIVPVCESWSMERG